MFSLVNGKLVKKENTTIRMISDSTQVPLKFLWSRQG